MGEGETPEKDLKAVSMNQDGFCKLYNTVFFSLVKMLKAVYQFVLNFDIETEKSVVLESL